MPDVMWWEYEQLNDHLRSREDIWSETGPGRWLRTRSYDDNTALLGIVVAKASPKGVFQRFTLEAVPLAWTKSEAETYFESLLSQWTDYGQRRKFTTFLIDEAKLEPAKASAVAVGLCAVDQGLLGGTELPPSRELWPDVRDLGIVVEIDERVVRSYPISGGGWLRVKLSGGMLKVYASLRSDGRYGGGFGGLFEGFIRPSDGNVSLAAAFLFGNNVASQPLTEMQMEFVQQQLRSVADNEYRPYIATNDVLDVPDASGAECVDAQPAPTESPVRDGEGGDQAQPE